ncbi:hypothetical protein MKW98_004052 [Papaver atlanticum]|uniref:Uncharacterized protein n=1 Tax=Papaver atlanticum TaxID=357466 RepID=A0AAD4T276_9MAGN|nr:hypothetical protein MKW98_004052 [Papaver atlanticum]
MKANVGVWKHTVERERYNILNILFSERITNKDGNTCNEDGHVVVDVPAPPTKKRGRPPGSKNKEKKTTNSRGDGSVQVVPQQESSGLLAQQAHMYPPNGLARDPMYQANGVAQ